MLLMLERGWAVREEATEAELRRASSVMDEGGSPPLLVNPSVLNACGILRGHLDSRTPVHRAWRKLPTRFGVELQAYTTGGNITIQYQQVTFKGTVNPLTLRRVIGELFRGMASQDPEPLLQLVVTQASIGRSIWTRVECLLEKQLADWPWARVVGRCEELCNNVLFQIRDWGAMLETVGLAGLLPAPQSGMVSVTRRGIITLRLNWPGIGWMDNGPLIRLTKALARFVHDLV